MSLLTMVQNACKSLAISSPTQVIGSTDTQIIQLTALANTEGAELAERGPWQILARETTHTTTAAEDQGLMTTIAGSEFNYIIPDTFWNRSQNVPLLPTSPTEWARMKSAQVVGPYSRFRIRGGRLRVLPVPTAGHTLAFEWITLNWCESSAGTGKSAWSADTDVGRLEEDLMKLGIMWRWLEAKGLDYSQAFNVYELAVKDALARDGVAPHLNMGARPGALLMGRRNVSTGSWSL